MKDIKTEELKGFKRKANELVIKEDELFNMKIRQSYESQIRLAQRNQIAAIRKLLIDNNFLEEVNTFVDASRK